MNKFIYEVLPPTGNRIGKKEGTAKDLLLDIPYLFDKPPAILKEGYGVIPPMAVINEIFSKGINDAGMSGGYRWEPFQIDKDDFAEIISELVAEDPSYFRFIEPAEWVKTYDDWTAWKLELLHGMPAQEYRQLYSEYIAAHSAMIEAGNKGDEKALATLSKKSKEAERRLIALMKKYIKHMQSNNALETDRE